MSGSRQAVTRELVAFVRAARPPEDVREKLRLRLLDTFAAAAAECARAVRRAALAGAPRRSRSGARMGPAGDAASGSCRVRQRNARRTDRTSTTRRASRDCTVRASSRPRR